MVTFDFKLEFSGKLQVVDKHWARVITSYDATKKYAFKFVGDKWIQKGTLYNLPMGTTILAYEHCENTKQIVLRVVTVSQTKINGRTIWDCATSKDSKHWIDHTVSGVTLETLITRALYAHWGKEEYDYNFFVNKEQREEEGRAKRQPIKDLAEARQVGKDLFEFAVNTNDKQLAVHLKSYFEVYTHALTRRISKLA